MMINFNCSKGLGEWPIHAKTTNAKRCLDMLQKISCFGWCALRGGNVKQSQWQKLCWQMQPSPRIAHCHCKLLETICEMNFLHTSKAAPTLIRLGRTNHLAVGAHNVLGPGSTCELQIEVKKCCGSSGALAPWKGQAP